MPHRGRIARALEEIDFHLAVMRENLEEEEMQRKIAKNRYHSVADWENDPDPIEC